jgi:tetratricopeptide (TPR) repeat protein
MVALLIRRKPAMRTWMACPAALVLIAAVCVSAWPANGQEKNDPASRWRDAANRGIYNARHRNAGAANAAFQEALDLAPGPEYRADTLFLLANACEMPSGDGDAASVLQRRAEAISAYKRIVTECPGTARFAQACLRLGEMYCCVDLRRIHASREEKAAIQADSDMDKGAPYFRKAVEAGPALAPEVLASKLYVALIDIAEGRRDDGMRLAREVADVDIYDVKEPFYNGPFGSASRGRSSLPERLDAARLLVDIRRRCAQAVISGDLEREAGVRRAPQIITPPSSALTITMTPVSEPGAIFEALRKRLEPERSSRDEAASAPEPLTAFDKQMGPLIEKAKSRDESERLEAVTEILAVREALSDQLRQTVAWANAGLARAGRGAASGQGIHGDFARLRGLELTKEAALDIMAALRLCQCEDVMKAEAAWRPVTATADENGGISGPGARGVSECSLPPNARLNPSRPRTTLDKYPSLMKALQKLRLARMHSEEFGTNDIYCWQTSMGAAFASMVGWPENPVYPKEVRLTGLFLLGEYRWPVELDADAKWRITDIGDRTGVTDKYPSSLLVESTDASDTLKEALAKRPVGRASAHFGGGGQDR